MQTASASNSGTDARVAAPQFTRARIVAEIRQIAVENSGAPPGITRFVRKSGIKRSAWCGKIWARWSDALREAGFAANPGKPRLDDDQMLAGIAGVARLLGRIPAELDLAMYRASGRYLPAHQTYVRHFGSKQGTLQRLKRWARASTGRADIAAMLAGVADGPEPPPVVGAVYLLHSGRRYKIGCSRAPEQRVRDLQQGLPEKATLIHVIETDDPHGIEAYWHRRFAEKRWRGEWFKLSAEDLAAFRQRRFQ